METKKTPLFEEHQALGGKMVEFAGWNMPIQYNGLKEEHLCVRHQVGLFDVSHMGEVRVRGARSLSTLEWLTSNDVRRLTAGQAQYSLLPNENGGVVDDVIVYCLEPEKDYLVCVNAANTEKDFEWMLKNNQGAEITNESDLWGQIAVQGPRSSELMGRVFAQLPKDLKPFHFSPLEWGGQKCLVACTGYTGEAGFEIFVPTDLTVGLWRDLLEKGQDLGVQPIGLGARDTLRLEMKYSLYGHEIDDTTYPFEAGLGWVVKPDKKDFIGREKMMEAKEKGLNRKLVGLKLLDRGIARQGYALFSFDNQEIGRVTSGTVSPSLNEPIAIGYVTAACSEPGTEILVQIRQRKVKAQVVPTPFVNPKGD